MEIPRNEITRSKDINIFQAFYSFYQISNLHQLPAMDALSVSQHLLALSFKKCIANLIGEKLDLIVVLICITLIICECGHFLRVPLLMMLLCVNMMCLCPSFYPHPVFLKENKQIEF